MVDETSIRALGLIETTTVPMHTTSTGDTAIDRFQYAAYLAILDARNFHIGDRPITATNLSNHGIRGPVGRDVLATCLLVHDGAAQTFAVAF